MKPPVFTVVIPTYRRSKWLHQAIQSVLDQTFDNFELIVVDDHSPDDTREVVASFRDKRIKYLLNDRTPGGAGTRNAGIFRAQGEWVAFLDDDDVWLPHKLELQYKKIQEVEESVGLIYGGYATFDFDKKQELFRFMPEKQGWIQKDLLYKNYIGAFCTVVIRSELLRRVGGLDEQFESLQDIDLYVRVAAISKIVFIEQNLSYIRAFNGDKISFDAQKKLNGNILFWQKYEHLINTNLRLRHRTASRVFIFSLQKRNWHRVFKVFAATLAGLVVDLPNAIWVCRRIISSIFGHRL